MLKVVFLHWETVFVLQEIEKAWNMVDPTHAKENEAKETKQKLEQEINNSSKLVDIGLELRYRL